MPSSASGDYSVEPELIALISAADSCRRPRRASVFDSTIKCVFGRFTNSCFTPVLAAEGAAGAAGDAAVVVVNPL